MAVRVPFRRPIHTRLGLEQLEDRSMLDAGLAASAQNIDWPVSIALIPNDPSFGSQFSLNNTGQTGGVFDADIDAPEAWNLTTGSARTTVGIIDTGIDYRHPDLYLNVWINQGEIPASLGVVDTNGDGIITFRDLNNSLNSAKVTDINGNGYIDAGDLLHDGRWVDGVDTDHNGYKDDLVGWDFVNNDNDPFDDNSHGTHVAGTIGAVGNNGVGVAGINWQVSIAALKFLDGSGSGSTSGAVAALNYATMMGIKITNNSWGGGGFSSPLATAISNFRNAGGIFVAAAGNSSANNDVTANYPSNYNYDNVVAVASTTSGDVLSSFSNYGATTVDLAAPGSGILSTTPNNTYSTYSGTSMATPHVTGAIALLWSREPSLTYSQVISRILNNVDAVPSLAGKVASGGRLNVYKALTAGAADTTGPRVVSVTANSTTAPTKLTVTFSEAIDVNSFTAADVTSLTGPAGAISLSNVTVQVVAGSGNTKFDISFPTQTAVGSYQLKFGPNITDTSGNAMDNNGDGTPDAYTASFTVESSGTTTFGNTAPVPIRDFTTSASSININGDLTIRDLNVKVNISHTYDSDLRIYLKGPDGTVVTLSRYRGGSGDNYSNTVFDDEAGTPIGNGVAPFNGSYRPESPLTAYDGKNARGTWTLYVYDGAGADIGTLNNWSLTISTTSAAGTRSVLPEVGDVVDVSPLVAPTVAPVKLAAASGFGGTTLNNLATWLVSDRQSQSSVVSNAPTQQEEAAPLAAELVVDHPRAVSHLETLYGAGVSEDGHDDLFFAELEECLADEA